MIETLTWVMVVLSGLAVGSFLNVVVWRLPRGESVVKPRSKCPGCGRLIAWYDNVPVVSWLLLGARCRGCKTPISARYPLVELLCGGLFALAWWIWGWHPPTAVFVMAALAALLAVTFIDWEHKIIPDAITLPGVAIAILASPLLALHPEDWLPGVSSALANRVLHAAAGAALGWGLLFAVRWLGTLWKGVEAMGRGDLKLLALIGAMVGPLGVLYTLLLASLSGSLIGILRLLWASKRPLPCVLTVREGKEVRGRFERARFLKDGLWIPTAASPPSAGTVRMDLVLPAAGVIEDEDVTLALKGKPESGKPGGWTLRVTKATEEERGFLEFYRRSLIYVPFGPFLALGGAATLLFEAHVQHFVTVTWPELVRGLLS